MPEAETIERALNRTLEKRKITKVEVFAKELRSPLQPLVEAKLVGRKTSFVCHQCGACCRIEGIVRLKDGDTARIAAHLGMDEADFIANETNLAPDRQGLVLKDRPDGACAMLDEQNRCRIYPVRPEKCRTFPYEWTNEESASYCPGLKALQ